jgi:hypothetical protein
MDDKTMLLVDFKVQIGYLKQAMQSSQEAFARTQNAHDSLMNTLQNSISELETVLEEMKRSDA